MNEVILILLVIVGWLACKGFTTLCEQILENIIVLIHKLIVVYRILGVYSGN